MDNAQEEDSLFGALGIDNPEAGLTPEDGFYLYLTSDKHPKLYNCEYWLKHQLSVCTHLREHNYLITKPAKASRVECSIQELVRSLLEYYFMMYYLPRFIRTDGRPACDMGKVIDLVVADPSIKKYLHPHTQS